MFAVAAISPLHCRSKARHVLDRAAHLLLLQVWFQLGNKMMPGGRSRISNEQLTPDNALKAAIAAWKAAAAAAGN